MTHLYEITGDLVSTIDDIVENGGELTEELEKRLDDGQLDFKAKVENVVRYCLNLDGDKDVLKNEIARLQGRLKSIDNRETWLKGYLKDNMEATDMKKIEFPSFTISIAKNPPSVEIYDEKALPAEYVEIRPTKHVDKKSILADLKSGKEVSGARIAPLKTNLRVK